MKFGTAAALTVLLGLPRAPGPTDGLPALIRCIGRTGSERDHYRGYFARISVSRFLR
jgi:hypothetical protein